MSWLAAAVMMVTAQSGVVPTPPPAPSAEAMEAAWTVSRNSVIASLVPLRTKEDLCAIAAYESSPTAARRRAAMPAMIEATRTRLGDADFGKAVRTAFCAETGKLCQ